MIRTILFALCALGAMVTNLSFALGPPTQGLVVSKFEPQLIPLSAISLPAFPYLEWPAKLDDGYRNVLVDKEFDQAFVIAGSTLLAVNGRVMQRYFPNDPIGWSAIGAQLNYANAIKKMGGVKVNTVLPGDSDWIRQQGGEAEALFAKLRLTDNGPNHEGRGVFTYDTYLIRRPQNNVWIVVAEVAGGSTTSLQIVEEKVLTQSISPLAAQ